MNISSKMKRPLFLVGVCDFNCPVQANWEYHIIALLDSNDPELHPDETSYDQIIRLPDTCGHHDLSDFLKDVGIPSIIRQLRTDLLFITSLENVSTISSGLHGLGFSDLVVFPPAFLPSEDEMISHYEKDQFKSLLGYHLSHLPKTSPVRDGRAIPFLNAGGELVIPHGCAEIWRWWEGGISPKYTIQYLSKSFLHPHQ